MKHYHKATCPHCNEVHSKRGCNLAHCTPAKIISVQELNSLILASDKFAKDYSEAQDKYYSFEVCPVTGKSYRVFYGNLPVLGDVILMA